MGHHIEPAVGIDLGTTYSAIAHLDDHGKPQTLSSREGETTTPSVVWFDHDRPVVGREAVKAAVQQAARIAEYAKRDVGQSRYHRVIGGEQLPPEVIQALILGKLKADAALKLDKFTKAVVTVPAYFNEPRRKATRDAGWLAGLEVIDIINEPTAAVLAFGVSHGFLTTDGRAPARETLLVYDLGGGTFDVTLMNIRGSEYQAIATAGDVLLGGLDWDERIADLVSECFVKEHGVELRDEPQAWQQLMYTAAQAKHSLSTRSDVAIRFTHQRQKLQMKLTRGEFEAATVDLLERTRLTVRRVLTEAGLGWSDVTRLVLVGGAARMPAVQLMLEQESGLAVEQPLSPDAAVAHGAAIYADLRMHRGSSISGGLSVRDVNSHDLGVLGIDPRTGRWRRRLMIPRHTPLPASSASRFETARSGQADVVVRVVEGGTQSGADATPIGRCLVSNLPAGLPARTPVKVTFIYEENGCLTVHATLPTVKRKAILKIERASGLSSEALRGWKQRIENGLQLRAAGEALDSGEESRGAASLSTERA